MEGLILEETLATIDGSLGWTVTLCAGAGWFSGFFQEELLNGLIKNDQICLGGSGKVGGTAKLLNDGRYLINGNWPYATGAAHCSHFTFNCFVIDELGENLIEDGVPMIRSFLIAAEQVAILPAWSAIGMRATGSFGFEIQNQIISTNQMFWLHPNGKQQADVIYNISFEDFAAATLTVNITGMAIAFFNACSIKDEHSTLLMHNFLSTRTRFYACIQRLDKSLQNDTTTPIAISNQMQETGKQLVEQALTIVNYLFPRQGMAIVAQDHPANRIWRNLHTASVHQQFNNY